MERGRVCVELCIDRITSIQISLASVFIGLHCSNSIILGLNENVNYINRTITHSHQRAGERERERQTDRQTDRQTNKDTERARQREMQTEKETEKETD